MRVIVQLRPESHLHMAFAADDVEAAAASLPAGFVADAAFPPTLVPRPVADEPGANPYAFGVPRRFRREPGEAHHIVRGELDVAGSAALAELHGHPDVTGVFADPVIERCTCGGDAPVGDDADVARLHKVPALRKAGMTGAGVLVAIVDCGINTDFLRHAGRPITLDAKRSFTPKSVTTKPGTHPVGHGTMCAFDAAITAPDATFLDCAVLLTAGSGGGSVMSGILSDALLAYAHLNTVLAKLPASRRTLVVSNSWGMFKPEWDFPVGHPGNYSDNPAHPFNVIVSSLEHAGADILFAAGNCGRECPDGRCGFANSRPICGANSHPSVLSLGGMDTTGRRVGYSSQGPGRLAPQKPDVLDYTHFDGSQAFGPHEADSGTSAACPVAAGLVAALRTGVPATALSPAELRDLVRRTATDIGKKGWDPDNGFGAIAPAALLSAVQDAAGVAAPPAKAKAKRNGKVPAKL